MVWGMIAKGVLGMAGSVLPGAVGEFFKTKRDAQSLKHDYKKAVLHERASSWKDEYIILVFTAQFPTFLVGFLLDPIIVYFFGVPWFQPAAAQYVFLLQEQLGVEGYKIAVGGCFTLAGVKVSVNTVGDKIAKTKTAQAAAQVELKKVDAVAKRKKKVQMPPAWHRNR